MKNKIFIILTIFILILTTTVLAQTSHPTLSNGVIGAWKFDETSGTTADNAEGTSTYDGTANNARVFTSATATKINTGADFTQGNDFITMSTNSNLRPVSAFTYSAWYYNNNNDNSAEFKVFDNGASGLNGVFIDIVAGSLRTYLMGSIGAETTAPAVKQWHHVIVTFDKTLSSNQIKFYLNGVHVASATRTTDITYSGGFSIGARQTNIAGFANGYVDELLIYNRAITQSEVKDLFLSQFQGRTEGQYPTFEVQPMGDIINVGTVSAWKFDETTGSVLDSHGTNHGTNIGATPNVVGKVKTAYEFSTSANGISVPDNTNLQLTGDEWSIGLWANFDTVPAAGTTYRLINKDDGNDNSGGYSVYLNGDIRIGRNGGTAGTSSTYTTGFVPVAGRWYHIGVTWKKGVGTKFYVDGTLYGTNTLTLNNNNVGEADDLLTIGYIPVHNQRLDGKIDEPLIHDRALTSFEIQHLYLAQAPDKAVEETYNRQYPDYQIDWAETLRHGMTSYWKFDETSGTTAVDSHGSNDGTLSNSRIFTSSLDGIINTGADFTQGADSINIPVTSVNGLYFDVSDSFSVSGWFKTSTTGIYQEIINHRPTTGNPIFDLRINPSNQFETLSRSSGGQDRSITSSTTYTDGEFHHFVYIRTPTSNSLYIDNVLIGTSSTSQTGDITQSGGTYPGLFIGIERTSSLPFNGVIDEVLITNRAYTSQDVETLYSIQKDSLESGQYDFSTAFVTEPTSTIQPATNITENSAIINAQLTSLGNETNVNVTFQYKTQDSITWSTTPIQQLNETGFYNYSLTGLTDNTTYEYKAITTWNNNVNETETSVSTFTTELTMADKLLNHLVGAWEFDDANSTHITNKVTGTSGAYSNLALDTSKYVINGQSITGSGLNGYGKTNIMTSSMSNSYSVSAWLYSTEAVGTDANSWFGNDGGAYNGESLVIRNGKLDIHDCLAPTSSCRATGYFASTTSINTNTWYHVVLVVNNLVPSWYINGELDVTHSGKTITKNGVEYIIGSLRYTNPFQSFRGNIDQVLLYDRAITQEEITALSQEIAYPFASEPTIFFTNITPENDTVLQRQLNATLQYTYVAPDNVNITTHWYNGTLIQTNNNVAYNTTITNFVDNLIPNTEYCWYINYTYDNTLYTRYNATCFTPNNEPKVLNLRIEDITAENFTIKWQSEIDTEWTSFRIGTDIMEVRQVVGNETNNWTTTRLIKNKAYDLTIQSADNTLHSMSDYYTFNFRTFGWNPNSVNWGHKRLITTDKDVVSTDKNNWVVELTLTEENFQTCGENWWDPCYPSFTNLNYTNGNDLRFYDYYDLQPLRYEITSWDVPGQGGLSHQTIPDEYYGDGDWVDYANAHDEDWNSNAIPDTYGIDYYNYTIPTGAKTTSMFRIYAGEWGWDIQIPIECYGGTKLRFKTEADYTTSTINTYCQNNANNQWINIWDTESRLIYETMMTWVYESVVKIKVMPYKFDDDTQSYIEGLDADYDVKFLMYYGNEDAPSNQTTILADGTLQAAIKTIGEEINYAPETPIISNVIEKNETITSINITWDVNQAVDNRIRYTTNPYLLETTWASRIINSTEMFLNQRANEEQTLQLDIIGKDYIGMISLISSKSQYNNNYTINVQGDNLPVEIIIPNHADSDFINYNITYTENKTRYRNINNAEFLIDGLTRDTTYYYEINAIGQSETSTETGTFTLGTPPSTPQAQFYSYTENRPDKEATICFEITNLDGAANVDYSMQHWNETSTEFEETTTTSSVGLGIQCDTIPMNYNENKSYRAKVIGITTGYSDEYTNLYMQPQEFFAGSYVTDDDDNLHRQYCPPDAEGYVDLTQTCYEQTGYREGSHRVEDWIWIETNITTYQQPYTVNWWNGNTWTQHVMNNNSDMNYLKLETLGTEWQTFYITDNTSQMFLNWTKPSLFHPPGKNRKDESKYVAFGITPTTLSYQEFYMRPTQYMNTTSFNWCQNQPGGNLYDCMMTTYWGTEGMNPNLVGTKYDRGQTFRGGIWNGDTYDTGVLQYTTPDERENSYIQTQYGWTNTTEARNCFSFTLTYFNESIYAQNNIENYYFRVWQEDQHYSSYLGIPQDVTWNYIGLFKWEYDPRTYVRDWKAQEDTKLLDADITRVINGTTVYGGFPKSLIVGYKDGFEFDISEYGIYESGIQTDGQWNNYLTGKHHRSLIIVNLPDNATLQATDSNSDGISDYDALFTYYIDPYTDDTSEDGWTDAYLIANGYDPNNPTSHPGPTVQLMNPINNTSTNTTNITFQYNATTPSGIKQSILRVYNNQDVLIHTQTKQYQNNETITDSFQAIILQTNNITWNVEVEDQYGIKTTTESNTLIMDITIGCTDPTADNYNPDAEYDDGSCFYGLTEIIMKDVENNTITDYSLWINGTEYIHNIIEAEGPTNITFQKEGWYNKTYNVNVTENTYTLTGVYQAEANFTAYNLNNEELTNFNVTINGVTKNNTQKWYLLSKSYDVEFDKDTYYNKTISITPNPVSIQTYNITGIYQTELLITLKDVKENTTINDFTIQNRGQNYTSMLGTVYLNVMNNEDINVTDIDSKYYEKQLTNQDVNSEVLEIEIDTKPLIQVYNVENNILSNYTLWYNQTPQIINTTQHYIENYEKERIIYEGGSPGSINLTTYEYTIGLGNGDIYFDIGISAFEELNYTYKIRPDKSYAEFSQPSETQINCNEVEYNKIEEIQLPIDGNYVCAKLNEIKYLIDLTETTMTTLDITIYELKEILIEKTNYINKTYDTITLKNQDYNLTGLYQATANFEAYDLANNELTNFNITINNQTKNNTQTWYLLEGEYEVEFSKSTWYNKTTNVTIQPLTTQTYNITGLYQTQLEITARDTKENTLINNFTILNRGTSYSTTNGTVYIGVLETETIQIQGLQEKYFTQTLTDEDVSSGTLEIQINTKPLIKVYDVENNLLSDYTYTFTNMIDEDVIINVEGNELYTNLLGNYTTTFVKNDWMTKSYNITLIENEEYNLTATQSSSTFAAYDILGNELTNFNITINGVTKTNTEIFDLIAGTYTAQFSKTGWQNKTIQIEVEALQEKTYNIINLYQIDLTITARDVKEDVLINNYTAYSEEFTESDLITNTTGTIQYYDAENITIYYNNEYTQVPQLCINYGEFSYEYVQASNRLYCQTDPTTQLTIIENYNGEGFELTQKGITYNTTNGIVNTKTLNSIKPTITGEQKYKIKTYIISVSVAGGTLEVPVDTKPLIKVYNIENQQINEFTVLFNNTEYKSGLPGVIPDVFEQTTTNGEIYLNAERFTDLTISSPTYYDQININEDPVLNGEYNYTGLYQVLLNVKANDVRGQPISGFTYKYNDSIYYHVEGTTSGNHEFLFGTYTFYFNKTYAIPKNQTVTLNTHGDRTVTFTNVGYEATLNLIDEKTLEPFDMTALQEMKLLIYCQKPDRTEEYEILTNQYQLNLTCEYEKIKFQLDYGDGLSYYRNIILPDGNIYNQTIYLINANNTFFLYSSFGIDDLLGKYLNPSIWVKKQIDDDTVTIQSDFTDIESKVGVYLIRESEYIIELHSDNQPIKIIGRYTADQPAAKTINMYDVSLAIDEPQGYYQNVIPIARQVNDSGVKSIQFSYQDPENKTTQLTFKLYANNVAQPIYTSPIYTYQTNIQTLVPIPLQYENTTIMSEIVINHEDEGLDSVTRYHNEDYKVGLPILQHIDKEFLNWFLLIILSIIAIYSNVKTPGMGLAVTVIALAFVLFGWLEISLGLLVVAILISLIEFMAKDR